MAWTATRFATGDTYDAIEAIRRSNYSDTLVSDGYANVFNGSAGNDTVDYFGSGAAVNVNLNTNVNIGSNADGDTLSAIEAVTGTNYADTLTSGITSTLKGGYGDDVYIVTGAGVTVAEAADGNTDEIRTALRGCKFSLRVVVMQAKRFEPQLIAKPWRR